MKKFQSILLFLIICLFSQLSFSSEVIKFSTLEWPPYLGANLPQKGLGIEILKEAFKAEGFTNIQVDFLPWSRALSVVENEEGYAGCLLAYYSKERTEKFIYSDPLISGPIRFAMRNDNTIQWNKLKDLKDKKIGVVQDYINSVELDQLLADKALLADMSISDENNLEKLALRRTDLAVVDINVFTYLLKKDPKLKGYKDQIHLSPKNLDEKKMYILFKKNKEGERLSKIFNKGLKKINPSEIVRKYMEKL